MGERNGRRLNVADRSDAKTIELAKAVAQTLPNPIKPERW
jgi:hypothetical protein